MSARIPPVRFELALGALAATFVVGLGFAIASCTLETGGTDSYIRGEINAPNCWNGPFDLRPDYFAAVPFQLDDSLQIRIQNGGDFQSFSDGVLISVESLKGVRDRLKASTDAPPSLTLDVSLPPEVTPPGVPVKPLLEPSRIHMGLYLQRSCRTQNVALYALDEVTLGPNGTCAGASAPKPTCDAFGVIPSGDGGVDDAGLAGDAGVTPGAAVGRSTITFYRLFSGDPDERSADERYTKAKFDVYLGDPRDSCPGGLGPPPPCRGHLEGSFDFYFQRGRPAQPFP